MRRLALIGMLTIFVTACGSNNSSVDASGTEIPGDWTITANIVGLTASVFSVTFVSSQCSVATTVGTFTVQGPSCFIADYNTGQGSISGSGQFTLMGVLVGSLSNALPANTAAPIDLLFVEADDYGDVSVFNGTGAVANGTMSGTWVCNTDSPVCAGLSGTFSATQN